MRALLPALLFAQAGALGLQGAREQEAAGALALEEGHANNMITEGPSSPQESDAVTFLEVERGAHGSTRRRWGRALLPASSRAHQSALPNYEREPKDDEGEDVPKSRQQGPGGITRRPQLRRDPDEPQAWLIHPTEVELQTANKEKVIFVGTPDPAKGASIPAHLEPDVTGGKYRPTSSLTGRIRGNLNVNDHMTGSAVRKAIELANADQVIVLSGVHGDEGGCLSDEDVSSFFDSDNILPVVSTVLATTRNTANARRGALLGGPATQVMIRLEVAAFGKAPTGRKMRATGIKESTWDQPVMRSNKQVIEQMISLLTASASGLDGDGLYEGGLLAGRRPVKKIAVILAWCHSAAWLTEPDTEECEWVEREHRAHFEQEDREAQDEYYRRRDRRRQATQTLPTPRLVQSVGQTPQTKLTVL